MEGLLYMGRTPLYKDTARGYLALCCRGGCLKPVLATVLVGADGERSRQRRKERYGCGLPLAGAHRPNGSFEFFMLPNIQHVLQGGQSRPPLQDI